MSSVLNWLSMPEPWTSQPRSSRTTWSSSMPLFSVSLPTPQERKSRFAYCSLS